MGKFRKGAAFAFKIDKSNQKQDSRNAVFFIFTKHRKETN